MSEDWKKESLRLKDRHGWKAKPGHSVCAIDRGAIRFDYPSAWLVSADSDSLKIRDLPEPNDNCILAVSQLRLPRELADQVAVRELVLGCKDDEDYEVLERKGVVEVPREDGVELAYSEVRHVDPKERREVCSRLAVGRGAGVYCLITFDFWVDDTAKFEPVWDEVLRSLTLGLYVTDPTVGPIVQ
jgi:hypothetical protein